MTFVDTLIAPRGGPRRVGAGVYGQRAHPTPKHPDADEADLERRKGEELIRQRKYSLAIERLVRALDLDPNGQRTAHRNLGVAYARGGLMVQAAEHYRLYVLRNPRARDAAHVQQIIDSYQASLSPLVKRPGESEADFERRKGEELFKKRKYGPAIARFRRAVEKDKPAFGMHRGWRSGRNTPYQTPGHSIPAVLRR